MPTLYNQAAGNVRKTFFLMFLFSVFLIFLGWLFSYLMETSLFLYLAVFVSIAMSISSYWFLDKIVLSSVGAQLIEKKDNPELYRLVENLCLSSGMPLPKIYIMNEEQPNAFATGRDEKHAVIAVTRGLLNKLERAELEGVVAHELSHIKNKDILLQTVVVVLVGAIVVLSDIFLRTGFSNRRDREGGNAIFLVLGIVAAILAPIAGTVLQMAVSRQREFLADASGALMTRYPEGLARALEKIASDPNPMSRENNATAHLFISSPLRSREKISWFSKLFMTHPLTEERVNALRGMRL